MKHLMKFALIVSVAAFVLSLCAPAQAYHQNPQRKFGRGMANALFGWTEIPRQIHHVNEDEGPAAAVTFGLVKGLTEGIGRTFVGIYEMVTFPIANTKAKGF